ncbi:von Willebrand factor-like [Pleurodeles waltl]|uniref:von Willebrand factor-like n=1 Tax=Pleurodeles waltl TaxID=8319 RepID=UPI003709BE08
MMMKTQLLCFLLVLDCYFTREAEECPQHQHFTVCWGGCQENCVDRNEEKPCYRLCIAGCICDEGYILQYEGSQTCVRKEDCESCPQNAYFSPCGARCQTTCENYNQEKTICPYECAPGCVCMEGYAMHNDKCIPTSECGSQ